MPKGKGTYGSKKGRPPKKMNMGGMTINKRTLDKMTPAQLGSDTMSQYFTSKVDESKGRRRPGMKKGGAAVKKMRYGGETRPMGSDPKPMLPKRPRPMPQESRVRVRPGMKKGGTVAMPKMMARGGALAKAARKELGVGSVGKEVMKKLGLTKGAISDREMEIFIKSSPKKKKPIRRGKPGYNRK